MGCQNRYGTIAVGVYGSHQPGTLMPMAERRWGPYFNYEAREIRTRRDPMKWFSRWSFGCKAMGAGEVSGMDGANQHGLTLQDWFNPPVIQDGCQTLKWIKGMCVDTSDAPLSGVNVAAFRTSDNAVAGITVQSREDGSYDVPTSFPGVDHFVRAYLDGSPDRTGVTLDTLQPTNIDGT